MKPINSIDLALLIMALSALMVSAGLTAFFLAGDPSLREALVTLCQAATLFLAKGGPIL